MQVVFHIDLNAFYASAEISRNPDLKGKPIVISGKSRRSIITTASYEAREFGILCNATISSIRIVQRFNCFTCRF